MLSALNDEYGMRKYSRRTGRAASAAAGPALRLTAEDLLRLRVADEIVPEPLGGAHASHEESARMLQAALARHLEELRRYKPEKLIRRRREKFLHMGAYAE